MTLRRRPPNPVLHSSGVPHIRLRRILLIALITITACYAAILILVRVFEAQFVFFPDNPGRLVGDWHPAGLPVQDAWLNTSDGVKLHAWWIPTEGAPYTFLAFHGNASNIANRADVYRFLHETPANVLAVEYRGYGHSDGRPSEEGIYRDAQAGYRYLVETLHIRPETIISFGQSLGTAVATHLAAHNLVAALILEAPFPSASAVARRTFPFLPGLGLIVHWQFTTEERMRTLKAPVMIVHCKHDPVLPFAFGERVFAAAPEPKMFVPIDATCHEEASLVAPTFYRAQLAEFLSSLNSPPH